jgi:hypothetical protein
MVGATLGFAGTVNGAAELFEDERGEGEVAHGNVAASRRTPSGTVRPGATGYPAYAC